MNGCLECKSRVLIPGISSIQKCNASVQMAPPLRVIGCLFPGIKIKQDYLTLEIQFVPDEHFLCVRFNLRKTAQNLPVCFSGRIRMNDL